MRLLMEKKINEQFLYDFYGELLTKKQKRVLDYYYFDDYNPSEIATLMNMTRQGVYDLIKRSRVIMNDFEEKLKLVQRFKNFSHLLEDLNEDIDVVIQENRSEHPEIIKDLMDIKLKIQAINDNF